MPLITTANEYSDKDGNVIRGTAEVRGRFGIVMDAKNCEIVFEQGVILRDVNITMQADGGKVIFKRDTEFRGRLRTGLNCLVQVGSRLKPTGSMNISAGEETSVVIGDDCMFAVDIDIRSDDAHPIFSRRTGKRINPSKSVKIGDHVWLGPQVAVLSGAEIGSGCVIGYRSVVKSKIPPNCIAAGIPAEVTKTDVVWDKLHISMQNPWKFDTPKGLNLWQSPDDE